MEIEAGLRAFSALSHEGRLRVFRYLVRNADRQVCVGDIAEALALNNATLSFYLKELLQAGLLVRAQLGRHLYYRPRFDTVDALVEFLTEDCCEGRLGDCGAQGLEDSA